MLLLLLLGAVLLSADSQLSAGRHTGVCKACGVAGMDGSESDEIEEIKVEPVARAETSGVAAQAEQSGAATDKKALPKTVQRCVPAVPA